MAEDPIPTVTEEERAIAVARSRRMYQTDLASNLATAEDRGRREGEQIGERRGERRGERKGRREASIEFARNLLARNWPVKDISEMTGLTAAEIEALNHP